jgi:hypothetical protein
VLIIRPFFILKWTLLNRNHQEISAEGPISDYIDYEILPFICVKSHALKHHMPFPRAFYGILGYALRACLKSFKERIVYQNAANTPKSLDTQ